MASVGELACVVAVVVMTDTPEVVVGLPLAVTVADRVLELTAVIWVDDAGITSPFTIA
jgi:hypothetical protein